MNNKELMERSAKIFKKIAAEFDIVIPKKGDELSVAKLPSFKDGWGVGVYEKYTYECSGTLWGEEELFEVALRKAISKELGLREAVFDKQFFEMFAADESESYKFLLSKCSNNGTKANNVLQDLKDINKYFNVYRTLYGRVREQIYNIGRAITEYTLEHERHASYDEHPQWTKLQNSMWLLVVPPLLKCPLYIANCFSTLSPYMPLNYENTVLIVLFCAAAVNVAWNCYKWGLVTNDEEEAHKENTLKTNREAANNYNMGLRTPDENSPWGHVIQKLSKHREDIIISLCYLLIDMEKILVQVDDGAKGLLEFYEKVIEHKTQREEQKIELREREHALREAIKKDRWEGTQGL